MGYQYRPGCADYSGRWIQVLLHQWNSILYQGYVILLLTICKALAKSIAGIAYQLTEADPLTDAAQCTLDANLMATLGANAIRVYHVDPTADHDGCMSAFAAAGIYLIVDLDTFNTAIDPVSSFSSNWRTSH